GTNAHPPITCSAAIESDEVLIDLVLVRGASPMAAAIMGNTAAAAGGQIEHLVFEGGGRQRPAMAEDDGPPSAPVVVIGPRFGFEGGDVPSPRQSMFPVDANGLAPELVECDRQIANAFAGRVIDRVSDRSSDTDDADLSHALDTKRIDDVIWLVD